MMWSVKKVSLFLFLCLMTSPLLAVGTYAEGWVLAKVIQFESRGIVFESYEGIMEIASYNKEEKCVEEKDECFSVTRIKQNFSVRPENGEIVNLLKKSINQEILMQYRVHRITAIALSSDTEILKVTSLSSALPEGTKDVFAVKKTGSKRNFSTQGKILQLDYQGTFIGTYEGLYLDSTRGKVHAFSVTSPEMANHAWKVMQSSRSFHMGISVAFATGFRKSDYDLFEINFNEPAGGVPAKPDKS